MRRPFITVVGIAAAFVALLFVAAIVAVHTADVQTLTAPLAARIKAQTGRDLTIRGGISITPSLEPRIEVSDIALGNPAWASDPNLITAKRMDVELALLPLLRRKLDVRRVVLTDPVISLETDSSGRGNWEKHARGRGRPARATHAGSRRDTGRQRRHVRSRRGTLAAGLAVGALEIDNGVLTYRNGRTGAVTHVDIQHLELHARDPAAPVNAAFRGSIDGVAVALTGNAGPLATLLERREPYPLTAQGEVAGQATVVKARLVPADTGTQVRDIDLAVGNSRVTGSIVTTGTGAARSIAVTLASPRLSLRDLAALPAAAKAHASAPASSIATAAGSHVIPDAPLPLAALRDAQVSIEANVDELVLSDGQTARGVQLKAASARGKLQVTRLHAGVFGGAVDGSGALDVTAAPPVVDLRVTGRDLDAGQLLAAFGAAREVRDAKAAVHLQARSRGTSLHEWASTATGEASIVVGPGTIPFSAADKASTYAQIATAVSPFVRRGDAVALHCAVLRMPLADGMSSIYRSLAVETDHLALEGTGRIDLGRETLDLKLRPIVRQGAGLIAAEVPGGIRVHGGFRTPQVEIDRESYGGGGRAARRARRVGRTVCPRRRPGALRRERRRPVCDRAGHARARLPPAARAEEAVPITDIARSLGRLLSR